MHRSMYIMPKSHIHLTDLGCNTHRCEGNRRTSLSNIRGRHVTPRVPCNTNRCNMHIFSLGVAAAPQTAAFSCERVERPCLS
jgi:hypothetical protein